MAPPGVILRAQARSCPLNEKACAGTELKGYGIGTFAYVFIITTSTAHFPLDSDGHAPPVSHVVQQPVPMSQPQKNLIVKCQNLEKY
jgi:hypothetical protein